MKKIIFILTLVTFYLLSINVLATGPSHMSAIIRPLSVNNNGVILCKTKFEQNSMGARRFMPIQYGWALIFPDGKIEEYTFHFFDTDSYTNESLIFEHFKYLEKVFEKEIDWDNPSVSLLPLIEKYKFNSNNVKKYFLDKQMSREKFLKSYNLNAKDTVQLTLGNHHSIKYGDTVHILYIINNIIFLKNYMDIENCERVPYNPVGAQFNFYIEYKDGVIDYDVFDITGIIKLKNII